MVTDLQTMSVAELRAQFPTEASIDVALTRKLAGRTSGEYRRPTPYEVADKLMTFLRGEIVGELSMSPLIALAGGTSAEMYQFEIETGGVKRNLVLRLEPPESSVQSNRLREFEALKALECLLPIPTAYWVDSDGSMFGQPGLISGFCQGVTRSTGDEKISGFQTAYGKHSQTIGEQFVDHLAALHSQVPRPVGEAIESPESGSIQAVLNGLNWWARVWREDRIEPHPLMTVAENWLRANAPIVDKTSWLHGDYRPGNFLYDEDSGQISAILDWELVRIGDRHEDLAYTMSPFFGAQSPEGVPLVAGLMARDEFLGRYEAASGLDVDPVRLRYYEVYTYWRQAVICLGTAYRVVKGQRNHPER